MKGIKVVNIPGKFYWYQFCRSRVLNFKCFCTSRNKNRTLGCFWSFLARTSQNVVNFVWNFDQWWHARWYIRNAMVFIEVWRNGLLWEFFLFTLSFTLWFTPQDFAKWKALLSYVSVVSFISIVNVVVKLKFSKVFGLIQIHEMVPFLGVGVGVRGLGPHSPNYYSVLLKFWAGVFSNKTNTVLENPLKCWILAQMECNQSL